MAKKKSWHDKLHNSDGLPKVVEITEKMSSRWGTGTFVVPAPVEVDELMKKVPEGRLITTKEIRQALAAKHGATIACPLTTGIFAVIAANAAQEEAQKGRHDITPYWRTLKSEGQLNPKYPGGIEEQKRLLELEGHRIIQKGKNFIVDNYEKFIKLT
ncbi:MAG TPA: MGMT family protein [Thermodesulfovibrionia bacterium]|nr:MGMT family protein [Thermodesulfovibrionia bacterium]